jgi:hypothetical protein
MRLVLVMTALTLLAACGAGDPPQVESRVDLTPVWNPAS